METVPTLSKRSAKAVIRLPHARDLYLVSNGVPRNPAVVEFIKYALSEGQKVRHRDRIYTSSPNDNRSSLKKLNP